MSKHAHQLAIDEAVLPQADPLAIGVSDALPPERVIALASGGLLTHVVQRQSIAFEAELRAATLMIEEPTRYFTAPLEVIFGEVMQQPDVFKQLQITCEASEKKTRVLTSFGDFVAGLAGSRAIWDQALLIADELYTNASKNAWDAGKKLFDGPPARTGTVDFFAGADAGRLVLGCRDSFGALQVQTILNRISTCYTNGVAGSIRHGAGGAGIGSYMVFDACASYYAGVEAGQRTVISVSLPLGMSRRNASGLSKNIHLLT